MLQQDPSLDLVSRERAPAPDAPPAAAAPVPARPPLAESRKLVTVLVADVGPTHAPDDPEAQRAALLERTRAAEQELDSPRRERRRRSAADACSACSASRRRRTTTRCARSRRPWRSAPRASPPASGLSTGEVVTGDPLVAGTPVDEAARLQERADAGEVLAVAADVAGRAARGRGLAAGGRVGGRRRRCHAAPLLRRLETPLVGRERELGEIVKAFERRGRRAVRTSSPSSAPRGSGRRASRPSASSACRAWRPPPSAALPRRRREATYAPLRDVLNALADGEPAGWVRDGSGPTTPRALAEQLAVAVGLAKGTARSRGRRPRRPPAARRPRATSARCSSSSKTCTGRRLRSSTSSSRSSSSSRAPVLVLCLARPDLLDLRPHWGGGRLSSSRSCSTR